MINGSIRFLRNHSPCVSLHILSSPIYWTYRKITYLFLLLLLTNSCLAEFKLGIENIPDEMVRSFHKKKTRIGLITNQTGKDQKGIATLDVLLSKGFNIVYLFAPEHGFDGMTHASVEIKNSIDKKTKVPIVSLYGKGTGKKVDQEILSAIDVFMFDIQDSGMRHYTYISTLFTVLQICAQENKKIIVFDRPNPLGKTMEGPLVEPSLISFFSIAPIPLRHGMTIGELAEYFNNHILEKQAFLYVVAMKDYDRAMSLDQLHAPLSPNIPCLQACYGYSFLGLLGEIRPFNVGLGTDRPFQLISLATAKGLDGLVWNNLAQQLKGLGICSAPCEYMHARKKEMHHGLHLNMTNINQVCSFNALLATIEAIKNAGIAIEITPAFDKAVGSKLVRSYLMGQISYQELVSEINNSLQSFFQKAQAVFKYYPHPELFFI